MKPHNFFQYSQLKFPLRAKGKRTREFRHEKKQISITCRPVDPLPFDLVVVRNNFDPRAFKKGLFFLSVDF